MVRWSRLSCERRNAGEGVHTRTQRRPREHFEAEEQPHLRPAPAAPYDVSVWATPRVARDHFAQVAKALYTLPTRYIGRACSASSWWPRHRSGARRCDDEHVRLAAAGSPGEPTVELIESA
jgi:hypothetical protein